MTNQIINTNNTITMSSREIADLTGKRHDNVLRDIEVMFEQLELDLLNFEVTYLDNSGRQQKCYNLDKELTTCLVSGYNVKIKVKVLPLIKAKFNKEETMNTVTTYTNTITMTSQEIAELVQSRHDNVKVSIERLVEQGVIPLPAMQEVKNHLGQMVANYIFSGDQGKRDTTIIVAQLSPSFLGQLVDRWIELEKQLTTPSYMIENPADRATKWIEEYREKEALALTIQEQQVDVDTLDRISKRKGSMSMRDAARHLDIRPIDLREWMLDNGWTFKVGNAYRPRASHTTHITLSANEYKSLVRVTWKGLVLLSKRMNKELQNI